MNSEKKASAAQTRAAGTLIRLRKTKTATKQIVPTITYDTTETSTRVVGEIGPDRSRGRAAALANIPEYGTVNNPPIPGGIPAVAAEEPRFEKAMQDLAVKALGL